MVFLPNRKVYSIFPKWKVVLDFLLTWYILLNGGQTVAGKEGVKTMMERFGGIMSQGDVKYSRICEPV